MDTLYQNVCTCGVEGCGKKCPHVQNTLHSFNIVLKEKDRLHNLFDVYSPLMVDCCPFMLEANEKSPSSKRIERRAIRQVMVAHDYLVKILEFEGRDREGKEKDSDRPLMLLCSPPLQGLENSGCPCCIHEKTDVDRMLQGCSFSMPTMDLGLKHEIALFLTKHKGWGVRAMRKFTKGEVLGQYLGVVCDDVRIDAMY